MLLRVGKCVFAGEGCAIQRGRTGRAGCETVRLVRAPTPCDNADCCTHPRLPPCKRLPTASLWPTTGPHRPMNTQNTAPMNLETSDTTSAKRVIIGLSVFVSVAVAAVVTLVPRATGVPEEGPSALATLNACLNGSAGIALVAGMIAVKNKALRLHRACMLTAFGISSLFLITYLLHHAQVGSVPFTGQGWVRTVYFSILIPHVLLAAAIVPMALFTIYRGWTNRIVLHRKVARWTLPLWLYVSASGVAIYWMLYDV